MKTRKLFYSYCHKDESHRDDMERALAMLRREGLLSGWHDRKIIPGQSISKAITRQIEEADLVVFLVSHDFLASDACIQEWELANTLANGSDKRLVPVILRECRWENCSNMSDKLALPSDGKPLAKWETPDSYWAAVYDGVKAVLEDINTTFLPKDEFLELINRIEFVSQKKENISLVDVFVFPQLYQTSQNGLEILVSTADDLLRLGNLIIRGEDQSGKTKLCAHLFSRIAEQDEAVLFVDLDELKTKSPNERLFAEKYNDQFSGDFDQWRKQAETTLILDNLTNNSNVLGHVELAKSLFDRLIITTSGTDYRSFFLDDARLASFENIRIGSLSHTKQEKLIRNWLKLSADEASNYEENHAQIDAIERNINAIVINNNILPRYPFFILSILQTYEIFMPNEIEITAYGHCYNALIMAHLIKSGVDRKDESLNGCFNFASHLAFFIHQNGINQSISLAEYEGFKESYQVEFIIRDSLVNRISATSGIVRIVGDRVSFSLPYSYFFFLGRHLATTYKANHKHVEKMIEKSYFRENTLSLIFAIHHAQSIEILDDILLHTECSIDDVSPASLDVNETALFKELMEVVPHRILSDRTVDEEREEERNHRDRGDMIEQPPIDDSEDDYVNQIYKSEKNIEILSQIVKNKTGSLDKKKISEIVETICDAGLRLVGLLLCGEKEIRGLTEYIERRYEEKVGPDSAKLDSEKKGELTRMVSLVVFVWTMTHIEKIVSSINRPELRQTLKDLTSKRNTPAYRVIQYFHALDTSDSFDDRERDQLKKLFSQYDDKDMFFVRRVLSIRTQHYFNTHRVKSNTKQATSSLLGIDYLP